MKSSGCRGKTSSSSRTALGILIAGLLGSLSASAAAQCGELTWVESMRQALDANQALTAARQTLDAQQKDIAIARSTMLPSIDGLAKAQLSEGPTFSSTMGVIPERTILAAGMLEWGLYNQANIDSLGSQKHLYESQRQSYEETRIGTIANAGQSYLAVLLQQAVLSQQLENLELTEQSLKITQEQERSGQVPYRNVLRWESQRYQNQQAVATRESDLLASRFLLNQIRNRPAEEVCRLQDVTVEEDGFIFSSDIVTEAVLHEEKAALLRDYLVNLGLQRSPSIRSLDAQLEAEWRKLKSARRWLIPSLSGGAGAASFVLANGGGSIDQAEGSLFWRIGLEMDWNVLQGGANIAEMNQAKLQHASLSWQRDNMATSLEENIRSTAASAIAFFKIIGVASLGVQTAQRNYALVNEAYLDGETTLIELIDAQQQLLSASISVRQALYEFLSKLLTLEQSIAYYPFFEDDADARVRELEAILQR